MRARNKNWDRTFNLSSNRDDVVQTSLNPHDSYKTSILAGLSPTIILDIAGRALNFYAYQVSRRTLSDRSHSAADELAPRQIQQEAAFQALITKNAQEVSRYVPRRKKEETTAETGLSPLHQRIAILEAQCNTITREAHAEVNCE